MEYYPQSMGPGSRPLIPFIDSISTTSERVIFRPPVESVVLHGGSGYRKAVPLKPPIISTQIETGTFATNFHEIRRNGVVNEETQLIVPSWIERRPTEDEVAIEREYWGKEKHWDDLYWEAVEKKLEEAETVRRRQDMGGGAAGKRRTSAAVSLNKSVKSAGSAPRDVQRADSYRRALQLNSPSRSVGSSGRKSANSVSSNGSVKPSKDIRKNDTVSSTVAAPRPGGVVGSSRPHHDDASSISSGTTKYHIDKCDTDSIHTAFSEEDVLHIKQGRGGAGSAAPTTLTPSRPSAAPTTNQRRPSSTTASTAQRASPASTAASATTASPKPKQIPKLSPRQRILVAQEAAAAQEAAKQHNVVSSDLTTATLTTPYTSRVFQVEEGFDPFDWGTPQVTISGWLWEIEEAAAAAAATPAKAIPTSLKSSDSQEDAHHAGGSDCGHTDDSAIKRTSPSEHTEDPTTAPSTCQAVSPSTPTGNGNHPATPTALPSSSTNNNGNNKSNNEAAQPSPSSSPAKLTKQPQKSPSTIATNEPLADVPIHRPPPKEKGGCCVVM